MRDCVTSDGYSEPTNTFLLHASFNPRYAVRPDFTISVSLRSGIVCNIVVVLLHHYQSSMWIISIRTTIHLVVWLLNLCDNASPKHIKALANFDRYNIYVTGPAQVRLRCYRIFSDPSRHPTHMCKTLICRIANQINVFIVLLFWFLLSLIWYRCTHSACYRCSLERFAPVYQPLNAMAEPYLLWCAECHSKEGFHGYQSWLSNT